MSRKKTEDKPKKATKKKESKFLVTYDCDGEENHILYNDEVEMIRIFDEGAFNDTKI